MFEPQEDMAASSSSPLECRESAATLHTLEQDGNLEKVPYFHGGRGTPWNQHRNLQYLCHHLEIFVMIDMRD